MLLRRAAEFSFSCRVFSFGSTFRSLYLFLCVQIFWLHGDALLPLTERSRKRPVMGERARSWAGHAHLCRKSIILHLFQKVKTQIPQQMLTY